ncbi:MAG: EAL domain-containing protein [Bacteriovorax sp.]|nr:EAL domain-containing protein [Rhizobacter sp.]
MATLVPRYDLTLVLASILIAALSAYLMLDLARRARPGDRGLARGLWIGGSIAMGTGIWSMHFVGMLAYSLPIALGFTKLATFVSWVAGVGACAISLWVGSAGPLTLRRLAAGSVAMGLGICAMHYTGMAALDMAPAVVWNPWLIGASAGIAVIASAASLVIFVWLRQRGKQQGNGYQVGAAIVMGLAVSGMHYTGMAAASFPVGSVCLSVDALGGSTLGAMVVLISLLLLTLTLVTSNIEQRMHRGAVRLAQSLKRSNAELRRRAELLAQAEEIALIGSEETDLVTGHSMLSVGLCRLFGEPPTTDPVAPGWLIARVPAAERQLVQSLREMMEIDEAFEFQHRIVRRDGSVRTVLHRGRVELGADGKPIRRHATLQDITARREAEQALHDLIHVDAAIGLPNRTALMQRLLETTLTAQSEDRNISLLVIGIDQFRLGQESLGYAAGDHLLRLVAQRLRQVAPEADMIAYLGAGEFALLLSGPGEAGEAAAQGMARALVDGVADPFHIDATEIFATCAVGVALCPADADGPDELVDRARASAQQAREEGTNGICFYTAEANVRASARLANEAGLRRALERNELYMCYQPQVDLSTGRLVALEALARWKDATRGEISPVEFIPLAEKTGLIIPIGEWALRTACLDSLRWQAEGLAPVRVAVNLSMLQLKQPDIVQRIQAILKETGLNPHHLGVEVTESMLLDQVDHVARTLSELKAIGIEIALDDFGTGYSNLSYLSKLPIDVLKIDRSFVHDVTAPTQDVSITRALISMAHGLKMKVLAEGVETEGQLALLVASRCDQMQGYYFSRPVRADAIAVMLRDEKRLPAHLLERQSRQRTLLLVDDEENIIASLRRLLRRDGYHIISANSGAQGLQRLAENTVDVILSDQRMPGMTGVEFLRRAKELYPETMRMSLSGYTELQSITDAINEGSVYKFLTKPWDDGLLRGHIHEAFRQKEMADDNRELGARLQSANDELAEVNARMQRQVGTQLDHIRRDEARLLSAQELLEGIPAPVIGFDVEGMVSYLNADAEKLFRIDASPLGRDAEEALSPSLAQIWRSSNGTHVRVDVEGREFQAVCRAIGNVASQRGKLMVLTPHGLPTMEQ